MRPGSAGYWAGYWGREDAKKDFYLKAREDFSKLLKLTEDNPTYKPIVYLWWSFLGPELSGMSDAEKTHYFQQSIELGPANSGALTELSDAVASTNPGKAIEFLKRSVTIDPSAGNYYKLATLQNKVGKYRDALESIKLAIALQSDSADYYEERMRAEAGLGVSEIERGRHLAEGFMSIGDARLRDLRATSDATEKDKAFGLAGDAYRKSLEILSRLNKNESVSADIALVNAKLARLQEAKGQKP